VEQLADDETNLDGRILAGHLRELVDHLDVVRRGGGEDGRPPHLVQLRLEIEEEVFYGGRVSGHRLSAGSGTGVR
jgi:hypothetical protein